MSCGGCIESSQLEVGAKGSFEGHTFTIIGSMHLVSRAGGHWNEHRVKISGGGEAWIAEAQGAFYWMREGALTSWESVNPGKSYASDLIVTERGEATRVKITGNVDAREGTSYRYIDLSGPEGAYASVDFGTSPAATFIGGKTSLADLGLTPRAGVRRFVHVDPSAGAGFNPSIAPGYEVTLEGAQYRVLGALARSGGDGKERWTWEEYLLWRPTGMRWLVLSEGHWNIAVPIDAGDVRDEGLKCFYGENVFRRLGEGKARVDAAVGEFPWDVTIGFASKTSDWVRAPNMISRETTDDEISWSFLTYLEPDIVKRALGVTSLPKRQGRAPNQPTH